MSDVLVLNSDMSINQFTNWRRALTLVIAEKAEPLKYSDRVIKTAEKKEFKVPLAIRLVNYIKKLNSHAIPFSKKNVFIRDKSTCQYCGFRGDDSKLTVDHVIPKCAGGRNSFTNCVTACIPCNSKKGNKYLNTISMSLRKEPFTPTVSYFMQLKYSSGKFSELIKDIYQEILGT